MVDNINAGVFAILIGMIELAEHSLESLIGRQQFRLIDSSLLGDSPKISLCLVESIDGVARDVRAGETFGGGWFYLVQGCVQAAQSLSHGRAPAGHQCNNQERRQQPCKVTDFSHCRLASE